jgi:hypothetical protein
MISHLNSGGAQKPVHVAARVVDQPEGIAA